MYDVCVYLRIDPEQASAAANAFTTDILPQIQSASGFGTDYWFDPVDGQDFGFLVFETEKQASAAIPPQADWLAPRSKHSAHRAASARSLAALSISNRPTSRPSLGGQRGRLGPAALSAARQGDARVR